MMDTRTRVTFGIEAALNFAISGFLNALCAWLLFRDAPAVPVDFWSMFIDTTITCFIVSICTALFSTASGRRYRRQGLQVAAGDTLKRRLAMLPAYAIPVGCCLFGMCLPVLIVVFGVVFGAAGVWALPLAAFMAFKGIWGGLFGVFVCFAILMRHLALEDGHDV